MRRVLALLAALAACGTPPERTPRDYPGELVPPADLPGAVLYRQRVTARFGEREHRFEAVVQKKKDALLVIGLGPAGTKSFVFELRGREVKAQHNAPETRALPPEHLLQDVERAFFLGLPGPPLADGERAAELRGERVVEVWKDGRLLERRFSRLDDDPPGALTLRYEGGWLLGDPPPLVRLDNGWLGYTLEIETLSARRLD